MPEVEDSGARPAPRDDTPLITPHLRIFAESVVMEHGGYAERWDEVQAPLIALTFRDAGGDPVTNTADVARSDGQARRTIESFGALDLACMESVGVPPDIQANYMLPPSGDRHAHCAFVSYAVPQLRNLGWTVEIDPSFPFQVMAGEQAWYGRVSRPEEETGDWFQLELGVEIDGQRVNLLEPLLELLDQRNDGDSLNGITVQKSALRRAYAFPVTPTHHVTLEGGTLQAVLRVLAELYNGTSPSAPLTLARHDAGALTDLEAAFAEHGLALQLTAPEEVLEWAATLAMAPSPQQEPSELCATLRPYQREGLGWLQTLRKNDAGGVLADDMGLGKTLQTIAHLVAEKAAGRSDLPSLVVAPTSLIGNWLREIRRFAPQFDVLVFHGITRHASWADVLGVDLVLTSYPILTRDTDQLCEQPWHIAVLDEAHVIKNRRSHVHKAVQRLDARHRVALTGTPVENHLGELWAIFDFLNPNMLGSQQQFRERYQIPIERNRDEDRLHALRKIVRPFMLRRLKSEVAKELPPKTSLLRPVEFEAPQRELYESIRIAAHTKVRAVIQQKGLAASTITILDALMKLRQLCCDPRLLKLEAAREVTQSAKLEAFFGLLETQRAQGHRMLVFSQFTSMLDLLSEGLLARDEDHLMLTGASKNRQSLCDRFEAGEADVFLISLKAGGTGLNLTSADTVVHFDPWWNPQAQAQATDRAYRIGQRKPVFVYNLFVAGTVEEKMLALQSHKRRLADAILAGELPDEPFSEQDVDRLLG